MKMRLTLCISLALGWATAAIGQQSAAPTTPETVSAAQATATPALERINLDVLVTDAAGKPVAGLEPTDFTILDDGKPGRVLAFRRADGMVGNKVDPPVEVIIVLDAVNMPYQAVTQLRLQLIKFLRQNDGHLAQPTSVIVFSSLGLKANPQPTKDGNELAAHIDNSIGTVRATGSAADTLGSLQENDQSLVALQQITMLEASRPGRKLLVWLGTGWPLLNAREFVNTTESVQHYFNNIVAFSRGLREARVAVYGLFTLNSSPDQQQYEAFLKPIRKERDANAGNLALQVLARQTGGRVLGASNDIAGQIADCIADAHAYYTLSFAAQPSTVAKEYHDLKVQVAQAGLHVRTTSGYYDQPALPLAAK